MTLDEMRTEIIEELQAELSEDGEVLDDTAVKLLTSKVKGALREVRAKRKYPSTYSESMIESDMEQFFDNVKTLALYDYVHVGWEGQVSSNESGISRSWENRSSCFNGIVSLSVIS